MTPIGDNSTPVLVLNCRRQGGLGIVRSLGRLGIPVWGVDSKRFAPPSFSRYQKGTFIWDFEDHTAQESLQFLRDACRKIGRKPLLIPTTDAGALFVAEHAASLEKQFIIHVLPSQLVHSLCSKKEMFFLATQCGIPTAYTVFPRCRTDVMEFCKSAVFPVMLKGIDGKRLEKRAGRRMFIVRSARELIEHYDRMEDASDPNLMLQEYIPGGDDTAWMFNGYFDHRSECLVGITGKKIHQYPIHTGLTSLGVCMKNETVVTLTQRFMRAIGYKGILDIGFRYDARDRSYKVLDVNPRIGATFRLFVTDTGMDVARALYLDLTGQRLESGALVEGRKWMVEDMDFVSSIRYLWGRKLKVREWLRSYSGVQESAFFAWDDPLPFLMMFVNAAAQIYPQTYSRLHTTAFSVSTHANSGQSAPASVVPMIAAIDRSGIDTNSNH
jgi:D-aspartate ligase